MILIYTIIIIKELKGASQILLRSNGIRKIWKIKEKEGEKKLPFCDSIPHECISMHVTPKLRWMPPRGFGTPRVCTSKSSATNHWFLSARGELQLCLPRERRDQRRPVWLCYHPASPLLPPLPLPLASFFRDLLLLLWPAVWFEEL